jgi:hypothetical protein
MFRFGMICRAILSERVRVFEIGVSGTLVLRSGRGSVEFSWLRNVVISTPVGGVGANV